MTQLSTLLLAIAHIRGLRRALVNAAGALDYVVSFAPSDLGRLELEDVHQAATTAKCAVRDAEEFLAAHDSEVREGIEGGKIVGVR